MEIGGVVQKGKGEGSFFMSLHPYLEGMEKELGYTPYQGTLNVHANKQRANAFISSLKAVRIPGFTKGTKTFGFVDCYPCMLRGKPCAILIPEFTRYDLDILEIISPFYLREQYNLKDGDTITLETP